MKYLPAEQVLIHSVRAGGEEREFPGDGVVAPVVAGLLAEQLLEGGQGLRLQLLKVYISSREILKGSWLRVCERLGKYDPYI